MIENDRDTTNEQPPLPENKLEHCIIVLKAFAVDLISSQIAIFE